ncbi:MAG: fatty acid CoA ligase family protein [Deltaproteobacteria bacterium]|nr:fatty acid CoA ligase family protein [Deltaproteobacteria bacterium]
MSGLIAFTAPLEDGEAAPKTVREVVDAVAHQQPNACELIHEVARGDGALLALVDVATGQRCTFAQLSTGIAKVASRLQALGVRPRDRVALFVGDGPRFVTLVNALFHLGAVPVLIDPGMGIDNVATCVREQKPRVLLGIRKAQGLRLILALTRGRDAMASVKVNIVVDGWFPGATTLSTDDDGAGDSYLAMHRQPAHETAAVLYTSGSTGAPKGVLYTHGMLSAQALAIRDMFQVTRGDVDVCCFLPFALFSVAMGTTAVFPAMDFRFPAKANPEKILEALKGGAANPATSAFASPALWEPFSSFLVANKVTLPELKRVLTAGAPVRPQLHERLLQALPNGDVFTPYGATEALPVAFMGGREVIKETATSTRAGKGTCVGTLAPGISVKIIGLHDGPIETLDDAVVLPPGEIGEIVVKGPCVTRAYDGEKGKTANALAKIKETDDDDAVIWHRMGDAGYVDDQGRLWFCGRKAHRVEVSADKVLHSLPVEAVVETLVEGTGQRAALVGTGERGSQRAVVFVEEGAKPVPSLEAVRALPGCKAVDEVRAFAGSFPVDRRHNAKIEREKLALLAAG